MALTDRTFVIVGGGLAGALMAARLGQLGCRVELYERRPDLRKTKISAGRSINLAISARGLHAIEQIGLKEAVLAEAVAMRGRMIHSPGGELAFQPYGTKEADVINSVSRGRLNAQLLDAAERFPSVSLHFDHRCTGIDFDSNTVHFADSAGGATREVRGGVVIGADGVFSAVRGAMQKRDRFDYRQDYLSHGYKELHIPPAGDGSHRMERNALHIWPRKSYMMIALPNMDGSYTVTCFWPFEGPNGFDRLQTDSQILEYFTEHFGDAVPLMPTLAEDYRANPASSLVTIRCGPWHVGDKVLLIGDAAHGIVPFYGQGMNAAFEDCTVLSDILARRGDRLDQAFAEFYELRKRNADAISELAVENFIEMRDKVGSPAFLRKKANEKRLHRLFPKWYLPLYSMISFSVIPYADAVERAAHQDRVVRRTGWSAAVVVLFLLLALIAWLAKS